MTSIRWPGPKRHGAVLSGVAIALMCALAASIANAHSDANRAPGQNSKTIYAQAIDRRPSDEATDWVRYADHVIVATAVRARELAPAPSELKLGEGLIGRDVTMRTDDVVWTRARPARPAPGVWHWTGMGWQFTGGDTNNRVEIALQNRPRVEVGHTYIVAIEWVRSGCGSASGNWLGLGEGSILAYDDRTIGKGEIEGREVSAGAAQVAARRVEIESLEDDAAGRDASALAKRLESAAASHSARAREGTRCK